MQVFKKQCQKDFAHRGKTVNFRLHNAQSQPLRERKLLLRILEQTSHCKNIQSIYQNAKTQQKGIVALSLSLHINERTLIRYRKKYLNCLGIFYMAELNGKEIAAADIAKILF